MEKMRQVSSVAGVAKKLTVADLKQVIGGSVDPNKVTIETKDGTKVVIE